MAAQTISLELSDDTVRRVTALGDPTARAARRCRGRGGLPVHTQREHTDTSLRVERDKVDTRDSFEVLSAARAATDRDLVGERARADTVLVDQRDAHEQLVTLSIQAQQLAEDAHTARGPR